MRDIRKGQVRDLDLEIEESEEAMEKSKQEYEEEKQQFEDYMDKSRKQVELQQQILSIKTDDKELFS